jgi:hypothetical protein
MLIKEIILIKLKFGLDGILMALNFIRRMENRLKNMEPEMEDTLWSVRLPMELN